MVDLHRELALAATAFVIIVIPGPSVLFVISRGVTLGRRAGLATVIGNESGLAVQVAAVAAGVGAIVSTSIVVFTLIKLVGAAYLIYLGVQAIRHRQSIVTAFAKDVVLGMVCVAVALLCDSVWALAADSARDWLVKRPERMATISGAGGVAIIGLGVRLAITGRKD